MSALQHNRASVRLVPASGGNPLLGHLSAMQREGLLHFYHRLWQQHGDFVSVKMGPLTQYLLVRPEHVHHVLVANQQNYTKGIGFLKLKMALGEGLFTSDGAHWQRQRRLMQPPFTHKGIVPFADAMVELAARLTERWQAMGAGSTVDVNRELLRLTMDIIARTMFGTSISEESFNAFDAFTYVLEFAAARTVSVIDLPLFVPTPSNRRFKAAQRTLSRYMGEIIESRRRNPGDHHDLLSLMLNARDEDTGAGMTEEQLYDEVTTIFFAGHETTAQALTWTFYLLAQHPEQEARLHEELDRVLGGRLPTFEDAANLPYTRMVTQEALRLYPPVLIFVRDAIGEDTIGGERIPPRSMVVMSQYMTHRHPEFWDSPEQFDPERFTPERSEGRPHYAYYPFGGGKRTCLGDKFAMLEMQLVLATIASRYKLRLLPGHQVIPQAHGTLRPENGLPMRLEPR